MQSESEAERSESLLFLILAMFKSLRVLCYLLSMCMDYFVTNLSISILHAMFYV